MNYITAEKQEIPSQNKSTYLCQLLKGFIDAWFTLHCSHIALGNNISRRPGCP
jgi:hypothetical protein